MFANANRSSKRDADSYAYEYAQCYTNGYGHADSDDYAHGYCNSYSYRYGHNHCQANADSAPAHDTEAASYASAATVKR
jgi:hypothetical protein